MIDYRKSYLNCIKYVWNGVKRYQILMYQKDAKSVFNLLSNFDRLKIVSKFSQGLHTFVFPAPCLAFVSRICISIWLNVLQDVESA